MARKKSNSKALAFQAKNEAARSPLKRRAASADMGEIASRARSLDWGGWIQYLPNPDPVLLNIGRDMSVFAEIRHDAHLTAVINSRKSGVKSMLWDIDRGKSKSRQAKVITELFSRLDVYRIINDILDYFLTGFAPVEVMWDRPGESGLILPYEVMGKPPEWFMFDGNNVLKFRSIDHSIDGEPIPPRKMLLPRHNATYKNPYGESLLSTCYWPCIFKFGGIKFWVKFCEKFGMPFAIGKAPRSAGIEEFNKLAALLEDLVQDAVAAIPDDSKIEFLEAGGKSASSAIYNDLVHFCNSEISKAILGQTLTTEAGDKGARALGTVHMDVRADIIEKDKRVVEAVFNELIRWIMEINFGVSEAIPKFTLTPEQDLEQDRANRDKILSDTGQVTFSQAYIESAYGFQAGDVIVKEKPEPLQGPGLPTAPFSEAPAVPKDQEAIDRMVEAIGPAELRRQAEFVKPIFDLFEKSGSYSEAMGKLLTVFDDVHPSEMQKVLARAVFLSEMWGRMNSQTA